MNTRFRKVAGYTLVVLILVAVGGTYVVNRSIDETYSRDWRSASTENAKYRQVFVKSPVVVPALLRPTDSIELHVTDAWVERPTRIDYRWLVWRHEIQDSSYRLVVNLAQVPRDSATWTHSRGRCFVPLELSVDGVTPSTTGNAYVHTIYTRSMTPYPDTVHVMIRSTGSPGRVALTGSCSRA